MQLPGVDDPARVKEIMQTAAMLEISEVKDGPFPSREQALAQHGGVLPLNTKLVQMAPGAGGGRELVPAEPFAGGHRPGPAQRARRGRTSCGTWETNFTLTQDGAKRFGRFTEANIGNRLAVVLDNQIRSVATIQTRIEDSGRITGQRSEQEASDLALVLRAGSLPAGIVYLEERTIGPSLGADSIHQGIMAGLVGLAAVIAVMLVYYKKSRRQRGAGADSEHRHADGGAGVLQRRADAAGHRRHHSDDRHGGGQQRADFRADSGGDCGPARGFPPAIDAGFSKAFLTIIDTHVTTVVSCAFLFMFGTGPVKGFAVTLVIGLIANLFTAVFVSRAIFDYELSRQPQMARLSI